MNRSQRIVSNTFLVFFSVIILYFGGHVGYYLIEKYRPDLLTCIGAGLIVYLLAMLFFFWICKKNAEDEPK